MNLLTFSQGYLLWHYSHGISALIRVWRNFTWATQRFFAISQLVRTLFAPWHRLQESYQKGASLEDRAATLIVNVLMRLVGFFVRTTVIVFGIISLVLVVSSGIVALIIWLFLPFIWMFLVSFAIFTFF